MVGISPKVASRSHPLAGAQLGGTEGCVLCAVCVPGPCWLQGLPKLLPWALGNPVGLFFPLCSGCDSQ